MIAQIEGKLVKLSDATALIQVGQVCYEVMLPGFVISNLGSRIGEEITLCTMEYYEGTPGRGNLIPRMVGFLTQGEKRFFSRYISVKGLGIKKGLKSLVMPISTIAAAIESGDEKILLTMPSIGKRLAQLIIAELKGKVEGFAIGSAGIAATAIFKSYQSEALEILIAWGEKRAEAMELVTLASRRHPDIKSAEELVPLVYRIKQGIEV